MKRFIKKLSKTYNWWDLTISYCSIDWLWYAWYETYDFCYSVSDNGRDVYVVWKTPYKALKSLYNEFNKKKYE